MKTVKHQVMLEPETVKQGFESWFSSDLGQAMLCKQRELVEHSISRYFGYHQLELLINHQFAVAENSLLGHRMVAVPGYQDDLPESVMVCESHELPVVSDSVDLVILHHTLDISPHPHQTLREACRVLRSGGHIVIVDFNPLSTWGLRKLLSRSRKAPWSGRFISSSRLEDWLSLLDLQLNQLSYSYFPPPISNQRWLNKLEFLNRLGDKLKLPLGAFYIMQAQKRVGGAIPLKPKWQRRPVAGAAVIHQFTPYRKNENS